MRLDVKLDKYKEYFVNEHCLDKKIVDIEWESVSGCYRFMLDNGAYIFVKSLC